ncbi:MAG: DEAD/DEAH box helicase [Flavobacteriaceae bacterium]
MSAKVLDAVAQVGYSAPTPIQAQAIPHVLAGKDVLGIAQTGTGKTASFVLPMLTRLERGRARARMPRTLIVEPTRELAAQVEENFERYGKNHRLTVALLIGGVSFDQQEKKLDRGADVLIATPGRLLDHFDRGKLLMTGVEILVIDEADRMLDMGFIPDIERICKLVPARRQTLFFSATMPPEIKRLTEQFLRDPVSVKTATTSMTADTVQQTLVHAPSVPKDKRAVLRREINAAKGLTNAIIFCNRKRDVAVLERSLRRHGFNAGALHGDMNQHERMATLASFRKNELTLLVASDVAARGLDIPDVSHVFNMDVPTHAEDYVHRIGRTGRAGRSGEAITLATRAESKYVKAIEELIGKSIPAAEGAAKGKSEAKPEAKSKSEAKGKPEAAPVADEEDEARDEARSRSGGRGRGRKKTAPRERREEPSSGNQKSQREKPSRRDEGGRGEAVVGFGDDTPDFLRRPVRLAEGR